MLYTVKEPVYSYADLGVAVRFDSSSSINGLDEMLGYESLLLSHVCLIGDEAPTFRHLACKEELSRDRVCLIGNRCLRYRHVSIEVHWAHLILAVITPQING